MPGVHASFHSSFSHSSFLEQEAPLGAKSDEPLDPLPDTFQVYLIRWWVLGVLSVLTMLQGWFWNIYGPIGPAIQPVFGWSDGMVALFANWGTIGWFVAVIPFTFVMDSQGLRPAVIAASALVFVGSVLRCLSTHHPTITWLVNISQLLNGLAGPCGCSAPPLLSAVWFAPNQRTTATSISTVCNYLGVALSFVIGPLLVPKHDDNTQIKHNYLTYMIGAAAASAALLVAVVLAFPNCPPTPPSTSAAAQRTDFRNGAKQLLQKRGFWSCALSYGLITGFYGGWGAMMADNLKEFDISQNTAGILGCAATVAGCGAGLALSFAVDNLGCSGGQMKRIVIGLNMLSIVAFSLFALACSDADILPAFMSSDAVLYTMCVLVGLTINGTIPLYYELCVEASYPIAEGLTAGSLITVNNAGCAIFLIIPNFISSTGWMNWAMVAAAAVAVPLFLPFPVERKRLAVDSPTGQADTIYATPKLAHLSR